ncbi:MAG: hypothetical protein Q4C87_01720 [Actinomycetaceae bacterium]|nr:hypothetical protein [Actinomycetaceae bacterium]
MDPTGMGTELARNIGQVYRNTDQERLWKMSRSFSYSASDGKRGRHRQLKAKEESLPDAEWAAGPTAFADLLVAVPALPCFFPVLSPVSPSHSG